MTSVKVPDELRAAFDALIADHLAIKSKHLNFSAQIHEEEKANALAARALWERTKETMGLEGEWSYDVGFVKPTEPVPNV